MNVKTNFKIAGEILDLMEQRGFTTNQVLDDGKLRLEIVAIIHRNIKEQPQRRDLSLEEADKFGKILWETD